jgi:hypothetical protein
LTRTWFIPNNVSLSILTTYAMPCGENVIESFARSGEIQEAYANKGFVMWTTNFS